MRIPELFRTASFRLALGFSLAFSTITVLLLAFIFYQTTILETRRVDRFLITDSKAASREPVEQLSRELGLRVGHGLFEGLRRLNFAGLFAPSGQLLAGNIPRLPEGLSADGRPHTLSLVLDDDPAAAPEPVRAIARRLPGGEVLVLMRSLADLERMRYVILRAIGLSLAPALGLALTAGIFMSLRALRRVKDVHETMARILSGDLHERLPLTGTGDDFDQLAAAVNRVLDELGRLLEQLKGIGNDIAHDLRTPLSRVRARLERARAHEEDAEALREAIDRAIIGLDQVLGIITALLRIGEIETRRRAGFAPLDPAQLAREIADLYAPIAEERNIAFRLALPPAPPPIDGDRELLLEALANLVGNAIKFTPEGGEVALEVRAEGRGAAFVVRDTGPGIAPEEREFVFKRFYRSDKSRHVEGSGLGLSLVKAIADLHGFAVRVTDGPAPDGRGAVFILDCAPAPSA
jgi:signal transduction histidine kinase